MADYTAIDNPELYFQTKIYTGNATARAITLDGSENMQPDWIWFKQRSGTENHNLFDSVRGVGKQLESNANSSESSTSLQTAFGTNGFSINDAAELNASGSTYVAWNWKAGTSFTNDASSTGIGTIDSAGSVSDTSGFSIVSWSGTGSNGTIKHGLSTVPKMIIVKSRSHSKDWTVYHSTLGNTKWIELNATTAEQSSSNRWNNTSPTSSVFTVATDSSVNASGYTYIAYCFSEKKAYSKFSSYTGNGSTSNFVFTGFKPAWLLAKKSSGTGDWFLIDNKRSTINPTNHQLEANSSAAEDASGRFNFLSNGFKCVSNSTGSNGSGTTYIYMAFAENPFVNSNGVPNNSR